MYRAFNKGYETNFSCFLTKIVTFDRIVCNFFRHNSSFIDELMQRLLGMRTIPRMDTIPNGHHPESAPS